MCYDETLEVDCVAWYTSWGPWGYGGFLVGIAQLWSQKFNFSQGWLIGRLSVWRYNIFLVLTFLLKVELLIFYLNGLIWDLKILFFAMCVVYFLLQDWKIIGNGFFPLFFVFKNIFLFLRLKNLFGNPKWIKNKNCYQNSIYEGKTVFSF